MSAPGIPIVRRITVTLTYGLFTFPSPTDFLQISNEGANTVRVYFSLADYNDDVNYISLAPSVGYFEGPIALGNGRSVLYMRSLVGPSADVVLIGYVS